MTRAIAVVAILCGVLLLWGGLADGGPERLRLSVVPERTLVTVVVTFNRVTDAYRWLSVYGCSAEVTETGSYCTGEFERESTVELFGRKQELFYWRNLPAGTMRVTAMAFDRDHRLLASGEVTVFRGR